MYLAVEGERTMSNSLYENTEFDVYPDKGRIGLGIWPINVEIHGLTRLGEAPLYAHLAFSAAEAEDLARKLLDLLEQEVLSNASVTNA